MSVPPRTRMSALQGAREVGGPTGWAGGEGNLGDPRRRPAHDAAPQTGFSKTEISACRSSSRVFALLSLTACSSQVELAPQETVPTATMPGPAPQRRDGDAVTRNDECIACHADVADEWQRSLHREAYTSREFQHALRSEPLPVCRGCHAPEADPRRPEPTLAALGVACVSCHVPSGDDVLSAREHDAPRTAPHPVRRDLAFAGAGACAGCHEFTFSDPRPVPEYMQTTIREHAASPLRDRSCADCHMPRAGDGHRTHGFAASRDEDWMRSVVTVRAIRPAANRIEVTLDLLEDRVGHAFPTGDLLRRLAISVEVARAGPRRPQRRYLARHWATTRFGDHPPVRSEASDDRLGVGEDPRTLVFDLNSADAAMPVRWRVDYERVESILGPSEHSAVVVGHINLGQGSLAPPAQE